MVISESTYVDYENTMSEYKITQDLRVRSELRMLQNRQNPT